MKSLLPWVLSHPTGKLSEDGNGTVTRLTKDHLGDSGPWASLQTSRVYPHVVPGGSSGEDQVSWDRGLRVSLPSGTG